MNVPVPSLVKMTVPIGMIPIPTSVSLTSAVHVVAEPRVMERGVQVTMVLVERTLTLMLKAVVVELPS